MKSNPMVLGFFRAQIRRRKIRKNKTIQGQLTKVISPDSNSNHARLINHHISSSMMILASDHPMRNKRKRKFENEINLMTSKKKMKSLDNQINTGSSIITSQQLKKKMIMISASDDPIRNKRKCTTISTNTRNPPTLFDLPPELLAEILKRLPVKYVLRCRCVQKSWNFLIKTPTFITNYQNNNRNRPKYLLFKAVYTDFVTIRFDDRQCEEYCRVEYLPDLPHSTWLAQSHGLICVTYMFSTKPKKQGIYLWNPLVQKYTTLPHSPLFGIFEYLCLRALAFGFVPQFNDYVVVHLIKPHSTCCPLNPRLVKIAIYSLKNNSWKTTSQDYVFEGTITRDRSVFVNGIAYWLGSKSENCQILVCFDTKTDTLREILLPDCVETPMFGIHPFGQSIVYFIQYKRAGRFDMWVLKGDSIDEFFWEKKMSITVNGFFLPEVLGPRNNGEPIVFNFYDLLSYNLDSHEENDFVHSWNCWDDFSYYDIGMAPPFSISPFVESLALLNFD